MLLLSMSSPWRPPKTILVPTDFGTGSDHAIALRGDLAKALAAELVIMHAWEIPMLGFPDGAFVATAELPRACSRPHRSV